MASQEQIDQAVSTVAQRNEKGEFVKGWRGGPGTPKRSTIAEYWDITLQKCPLSKWGEIVQQAVDDALSESVASRRYAREWLGRMFVPAIERILVASLNVNVDASDSQEQVKRLVQMLLGSDRTGVDLENSDVIDMSTVDDKQQ